jgi:hypothetical protein
MIVSQAGAIGSSGRERAIVGDHRDFARGGRKSAPNGKRRKARRVVT